MERIQKILSRAGIASRRKAEEFIKSGQVFINGKKAKLGDKADTEKDEIKVYGKITKPSERLIYVLLNKPKGYITSRKDPHGRKTIYSLLPENLTDKIWSVGRLDYNTEGLLILTNDGNLTQQLTHPKFEHEKEYLVHLEQEASESHLKKLQKGVKIQNAAASPAKTKQIDKHTILLTIHEGKKHQVKQMLEAVGLSVIGLKRIRMGKLKLPESLPLGKYKIINKEEVA